MTKPSRPASRATLVQSVASLALALALSISPAVHAQTRFGPGPEGSGPLVLRAGRVVTVTGAVIENGVVSVGSDGRIASVGAGAAGVTPDIDLPGAWLVPGFVDLHCHVGGIDINDMVHPVNPDLNVLDQVTPGNEELLDGLAGGVTTVLFIPGSGTNMGGFGALLKAYGRTLDEMVVRFPGALKIAQAGNPERRSGEIGRGRLGMNWNLRQALQEGRAYHDAWSAWEEGRSTVRPDRNLRLEHFRGLFRREFPVLVHTQWFPVYQSSVRMLHDEFGLWVVLSHTEFDSYLAAPLVAARDMFVNVGPRALHQDYDTGQIVGLAVRHRAGGVRRLSVNTDSPVVPQEELPFQAAMAVRYGLPWDVALRALTIEPATAIGLQDRVGSIEAGKDADLVFWSGDPMDPRSRVLLVIGQGRIVLDQRDPNGDRRW